MWKLAAAIIMIKARFCKKRFRPMFLEFILLTCFIHFNILDKHSFTNQNNLLSSNIETDFCVNGVLVYDSKIVIRFYLLHFT